MNTILLLGYSSIAQKSIIPALKRHPHARLTAIASRSKSHLIPHGYNVFNDYKKAIDAVSCDTVYISLHNSAHVTWILYALEKGKNVICDKPVVLNQKEARMIIGKAAGKRVIFEATQYLYHPAHKKLTRLIRDERASLQHITLQFGYPRLPRNNFRNSLTLGGGCVFDLGPYVVSAGYHYFGKIATDVSSYIQYEHQLPVTATISLRFSATETLQAAIGFGREYRNHLEFWGGEYYFSLDRAFTIPRDIQNTILLKRHDRTSMMTARARDSFYDMFTVFANLKRTEYRGYNERLLDRLIMLDAINVAGKSGGVYHIPNRTT